MSISGIRLRTSGFTLVELLVSMVIIALLLLALVSITDSTQKIWVSTTTKVAQFQDAREAFETITHKLSQATLNTYLDYNYPIDPSTGAAITSQLPISSNPYGRQSELRFISGAASSLLPSELGPTSVTHTIFFQAPIGYESGSSYSDLDLLLNTCGYYIQFGDDSLLRPTFITPQLVPLRYRFRLMEMVEPTETLTLYNYTNGKPGYSGTEWFTKPLKPTTRPVQVRAENILALIILPMLSPNDEKALINKSTLTGPVGTNLAPSYAYDSTTTQTPAAVNSKNQLPPVIQVTMVAVDETSYKRFQGTLATEPSLVPNTLFGTVGDLTNPNNQGYAQDLQTFETTLLSDKLNYRVFTTNINIKAAKWSRAQTN